MGLGLLVDTGAFVLVLGIIIFFHEFGHLITAKAFGMRVFIFSFGFGRRLVGFKWGDTDCRVSLIPLGGYVKLEGEGDDVVSEDVSRLGDGRDFTSRPRWQRFLVYLAGPAMNVVLTVAVFTALYMIGFGVDATLSDRPVVGSVEAASPAAEAGLEPGDEIRAIGGKPVTNWEDAFLAVALRPDTPLELRVARGGEERTVSVRTRANASKQGEIGVSPLVRVGQVLPDSPALRAGLRADDGIVRIEGKPIRAFEEIPKAIAAATGTSLVFTVLREGGFLDVPVTPKGGRVGIAAKTVFKRFGLPGAVREACRATGRTTVQTVAMLGDILTARISPKAALTGPVGIAQASGDAARGGSRNLLFLVAFLSLSVGIMNVLPLPPLDGGHLAIIAGEGLIRRDLSLQVKAWIMNAGAIALFVLIGLVLYSDLSKTSWLGRYLP